MSINTSHHVEAAAPLFPGFPDTDDMLGSRPSFHGLLLGCPFVNGGAGHDAAVLAGTLLADHVCREAGHLVLADTLMKVRLLQAPGLCLAAARNCRGVVALGGTNTDVFAESSRLFAYFSAAQGNREAAHVVASEAISLADNLDGVEAFEVRAFALGWLHHAHTKEHGPYRDPRSRVMAIVKRIESRMHDERDAASLCVDGDLS